MRNFSNLNESMPTKRHWQARCTVSNYKRKKYEEEISAEVFMEIRMNPAHGPSVDAASHPLYDVLAKSVGKALDKFSIGAESSGDKGK